MEIIISQDQDSPQTSIMKLRGALDGSSYEYFIAEAEKLFDNGTRNLLLDMSELSFLSSAGLAGLHRVARVFRGEDRSTFEEGWGALRSMGNDSKSGLQQHFKLLNPSEKILAVLDTVGFKGFFEIYSELQPAIASFK